MTLFFLVLILLNVVYSEGLSEFRRVRANPSGLKMRKTLRKDLHVLGSVVNNLRSGNGENGADVTEIPMKNIDFSIKELPETFVEKTLHNLELEPAEIHPPVGNIEHLDIPMTSPPIDEESSVDEEHQMLYLRAQHAEVVRYSSEGWVWVITSLGKSKILRRISKHLAAVMTWTGILTALHAKGLLRRFLIRDAGPINLLIAQLSLLLVFRTNSAYERMWHSRGMLEELVNSSRQLAISIRRSLRSASMGTERTKYLKQRYIALLGILPKLLLAHAAYEPEGKKILADARLSYEDQRVILEASNSPLRCIQLMRESLEELPSRSIDLGQVDGIFDRLVGIIGGAEKIVRTPVPKSYSRHTSRFLTFACLYYPFVLLPTLGILTLPTMLFFCWSLMGIEEIGHIIENSWEPDVRNDIMNTEHIIDIIDKDIRDIMAFGDRFIY